MDKAEAKNWYEDNHRRYQDLAENMDALLKTVLREKRIPYYSVTHRVKTQESFLEKWDRKDYSDPAQEMDFAGLRVITQTTAEVKLVCGAIRQEFRVDEKNSGDKASALSSDRVGYLSVHYVVFMKKDRLELPEYARFQGMRCEIQVRSLLQNAWAEIEHDRGYKFAGRLPPDIDRRFRLVAGALELMDREFCALSDEIDAYAKRVQRDTEAGRLEIPIDSTSLEEYMNHLLANYPDDPSRNPYPKVSNTVIPELEAFGITTLRQLDDLLRKLNFPEAADLDGKRSDVLLLREAMLFSDPDAYFGKAWNNRWGRAPKKLLDKWFSGTLDRAAVEKYVTIHPSKAGDQYIIKPQAPPSAETGGQTGE